jgi:F-type H+-transporting ATPase subunit delta
MAGRYASALFDLAREDGALDQVAADLDVLGQMLTQSADLVRMVRSSVFDRDEQSRAMFAVMERAGLSRLTQNFIGVVIQNRRLFALSDMIKVFGALLAEHRGEVSASVVSARPLSDAQMTALKDSLMQMAGRDVQLDTEVDADLIGGLVVRLGSRMIDTSIQNKLNNIQLAMKEA